MKNILVISTSIRKGGNSDTIANAFIQGSQSVNNKIEKIYADDLEMHFCTGCMTCQTHHICPIQDGVKRILDKMSKSDVIVFATPIYFYEMCGQMKVLLDRTNLIYDTDYQFRDIYLIATAADGRKSAVDGAVRGLQGWIDCFPKAHLQGVLYGVNLTDKDDAKDNQTILQEAFHMGSAIS